MTVYGRGLYRSRRFMECVDTGKAGESRTWRTLRTFFWLPSLRRSVEQIFFVPSIDPGSPRLASPCPALFPRPHERWGRDKTQNAIAHVRVWCTSPIPTWRYVTGRTCLCSREMTNGPRLRSSFSLSFHLASHPSSNPDKPDVLISTPIHPFIHFVRPFVRTPGQSPFNLPRPYIIDGTPTNLSTLHPAHRPSFIFLDLRAHVLHISQIHQSLLATTWGIIPKGPMVGSWRWLTSPLCVYVLLHCLFSNTCREGVMWAGKKRRPVITLQLS